MRNVWSLALTTALIVSSATVAWVHSSPAFASGPAAESAPGTVVVPENVLMPLIDEPEHHVRTASSDFARGERFKAATEIRAGAALVKLEAARHDATNRTGLEDAAKQLDDLRALTQAQGSRAQAMAE